MLVSGSKKVDIFQLAAFFHEQFTAAQKVGDLVMGPKSSSTEDRRGAEPCWRYRVT